MANRSGTGWTSPAIIVAALAIASNAGWAYVELSRADTKEVRQTIGSHDRDIAVLKMQASALRDETRELREELRRGRPDGGSR